MLMVCLVKMKIYFMVPQGSILGPILFTLYIEELQEIIINNKLCVQVYADDIQLYASFDNSNAKETKKQFEKCLSEVHNWMDMNYLKINQDKTNALIINPKVTTEIDIIDTLEVDFDNFIVQESQAISLLGVQINETLSLGQLISKKSQVCWYHLRNFFHIKNCLPFKSKVLLVTNFILSKLDYCNSLLATAYQARTQASRQSAECIS